ncbi:hypothetical protein DCO58_05935 [Helicobacter saguini]|uniref:Uncharacterized protein n=1 Tax=Helicobacter saguini TaxID=1548018 RepID=A0A347W3T3_9HELI|nr:hypothetical protein [Helicobacter saguini]MWV62117.1 hypothetical protein [Helicobacter saguini]MWV67211.1 hypothetical protein [Helicobacter saguini]MWV69563.1 hypothetical protein [Helicobacter saguini]MWV70886.1 hypothetical protein [Helicobacter saguini]TLD94282.1 hypothetical protein LS64_006050 [Helicobacter saguini]
MTQVANKNDNSLWFYGMLRDFSLKNMDKIKMRISGTWHTNRYLLRQQGIATYRWEWEEETISCSSRFLRDSNE